MKIPIRLPARRRLIAVAGATALVSAGLVAVATNAYAAPGCSVTYANSWSGGNGFGANIAITNTGDPITNGWSLVFNFPGNQQVTNGWPVPVTQSGTQVTVASDAAWNANLATGQQFNVGFNGSFSGQNDPPTSFTLNGTVCNGGTGANTPPAVSLTAPTLNQNFAAGSPVGLAATASDNGAVARVDFLVDGVVVGSDTSSPYSFSAPNVANGSHTAAARAVDNGSPALTTTTPGVAFTVGGGTSQPSITATPPSLTVAGGASGTSTIRLSQQPAANVSVSLTRSGSTAITANPTTVTLTPANWQNGVNVTFTAAAGTAAATSTFAAAAAGHTGTNITVTRQGSGTGGRVNNPYDGAGVYNNPQWRANANSIAGGNRISMQPTGVWMDRISSIAGNGSPTTGSMGLADHLNEAVTQDAANGAAPFVFQVVIYNLPGRDCAALASNGELGPTDIARYRTEYIDVIAEILRRPAYANLRIVTIIEIDSLPNLVTNVSPRNTSTPQCDVMLANGNYVNGVGYALATLGAVPNVYNYIDAGHHGWLGWDTNFNPSVDMMMRAATASGSTVANVHGFITNTANTSALIEPYITVDATTRTSTWIDFNQFNDELSFAQAFRNRAAAIGFDQNIGMLIDTSRTGWGGPNRPTGPSTASDLNTRINASRVDRRIHKGNWCNASGAGLGERPRAAPAAGIDAYVWIKPPGESDGSSTLIPNDEGKGFDRMCDPSYTGNPRNNNNATGALPNAPLSGHWFPAQFQQLMANAFPAL